MFFSFNNEGRVMITAKKAIYPGMVELTPPEGFTPETQADWLYTGEWVHDPLPVPDDEEAQLSYDERISALETENAQLKEALDLLLSGEVE